MIVEIDEFRTTVIAFYYRNSGWMRKESKPLPSEDDGSRTEKAGRLLCMRLWLLEGV